MLLKKKSLFSNVILSAENIILINGNIKLKDKNSNNNNMVIKKVIQ
tara:strand:+ start:74 stop:211 length:138 start_codon:yes stop_codon:yes gene_type:complete